jgi:indolepyruvate ferredoxin oxidoreductase
VPGSTRLAEAVARDLHKLLAYKDEYEVARLHLDPGLAADVAERFGPDSKVAYRLHPPALRAMGMRRKIALGDWLPQYRLQSGYQHIEGHLEATLHRSLPAGLPAQHERVPGKCR